MNHTIISDDFVHFVVKTRPPISLPRHSILSKFLRPEVARQQEGVVRTLPDRLGSVLLLSQKISYLEYNYEFLKTLEKSHELLLPIHPISDIGPTQIRDSFSKQRLWITIRNSHRIINKIMTK